MIGIAGPSGAGKTFLAEQLAAALNGRVLATDRYYRDLSHLPLSERARANFDHPDSLDAELLGRHLAELRDGKPAQLPTYDFTAHIRLPRRQLIGPPDVIIVEGVFALYWSHIRASMHTKVYVDLQPEDCLERRIERDVRERGRSPDSVRQQFAATVMPMAKLYVRPCIAYADIVVSGSDPVEESVARVLAHQRRRSPNLCLKSASVR